MERGGAIHTHIHSFPFYSFEKSKPLKGETLNDGDDADDDDHDDGDDEATFNYHFS